VLQVVSPNTDHHPRWWPQKSQTMPVAALPGANSCTYIVDLQPKPPIASVKFRVLHMEVTYEAVSPAPQTLAQYGPPADESVFDCISLFWIAVCGDSFPPSAE
jgi:hypothetical protein